MIGMFDSGIGGATLLSPLRQELPSVPLCYVADHRYAPYGPLPAAAVSERARCIAAWLVERGAKLILVACNTATAMAIDDLRAQFAVPIVGVEPGVKPAALRSTKQKIGILATPNTLVSSRYQRLIERFAPNVTVISQQCVGLAEAIENQSSEVNDLLASYVQPLLAQGIDQIALGCTHYALLMPAIAQLVGADVSIIDTRIAITQEVKRRYPCGKTSQEQASLRLFTTGAPEQLTAALQGYAEFAGLDNGEVETLTC